MDLLKFVTAGSVDDGKSTLIGRLLYDTKTIFEDTLEQVKMSSERRGDGHTNLALVTDGLRAEREQGITIDVAYRYFATPKRKFILADTPGHIQYTRNMVTGASNADLAIVMIDARHGVIEQTKRHSFIVSLLGIKHVVVAINKMDLVDFKEEVFEQIKSDYLSFTSKISIPDLRFVPMSALDGDNVVDRSTKMEWYQGPTLLYILENVQVSNDHNFVDSRFPVQYVVRPMSNEHHDFRGYAGRVAGGVFKPGDEVTVLPSGFGTKVKAIHTFDGEIEEAFPPMSVTITLEDEIDISRGDMIAKPNNKPVSSQDVDLMLCWLGERPLIPGGKYMVMHANNDARCMIKEVVYKMDINTLHRVEDDKSIRMNDIGRVRIRTTKPLHGDIYSKNRFTGSLILVEEGTNNTVAAGIII
ncbi:MAG: sulfate adenylyltransferase subunit CysN [Bacteroidetes bacterium]|nr:sulfate adenylyltransferase subunit CysN [Bacteroidota bacterium]